MFKGGFLFGLTTYQIQIACSCIIILTCCFSTDQGQNDKADVPDKGNHSCKISPMSQTHARISFALYHC